MDFFKFRKVNEEGGAGEIGTPSLVAKYKNLTPGQSGSAPTRQPARKGDKLNAKDEPKHQGVKEATEQIDELSKETLASYKKKAGAQASAMQKAASDVAASSARPQDKAAAISALMKKGDKRYSGITKATKKEFGKANEEAEINEISKRTLGSYVKKASQDAVTRGMNYGAKSDQSGAQKGALSKINKREAGIRKATDRLTKEDADQIDELKISTLTRYGTKATQSLGKNPEKTDKRIKGIQAARYKVQQKAMKKEDLDEAKKMEGEDPCWKNYEMIGTKKKGGKEVPNCVPKNEQASPMIKPPAAKEFGKKQDAFAHVKKHGGKVMRKTFINPRTGIKTSSYYVKESASYKVDVEGLPTMYIASKSPAEVKANLRRLLKRADSIRSVERVMSSDVRKAFRLKAQGKEESVDEGVMKNIKRAIKGTDAESRAGEEATKMMKAQQAGDNAAATKYNKRFKKLSALTKKEHVVHEKLDPSMGAGEYVKDFEKSDAPQFKGKTKKERQKMAVAAYLSAKRGD